MQTGLNPLLNINFYTPHLFMYTQLLLIAQESTIKLNWLHMTMTYTGNLIYTFDFTFNSNFVFSYGRLIGFLHFQF